MTTFRTSLLLYSIMLLLLSCSDCASKISSLHWEKGMLELEFVFDDGLGLAILQPKLKKVEYSSKSIFKSINYICKKTELCKNYGVYVLSNPSLYGKMDSMNCRILQTAFCNELKKNWLAIYSSGSSQIITYPYVSSMRKVWSLKE